MDLISFQSVTCGSASLGVFNIQMKGTLFTIQHSRRETDAFPSQIIKNMKYHIMTHRPVTKHSRARWIVLSTTHLFRHSEWVGHENSRINSPTDSITSLCDVTIRSNSSKLQHHNTSEWCEATKNMWCNVLYIQYTFKIMYMLNIKRYKIFVLILI